MCETILKTMNTLRNSVQLIGNLGKDVELKTFESGTKKASFSLATSEYYTNKEGEKVNQTEWHNIIAWGKTAEVMSEILKKGHQVAIQGKLIYNNYQDKEGVKKYITQVQANEFYKITKDQALPF